MESDMRLRDLRPRTIEGYLLAIRLFIERVDKEPEKLKEEDVRGYVLHLRDDRHQAPSSINIAICALRFFFNFTLQRDFEVFNLLRVHRTRSLPVVLSRGEVCALLSVIRHPVRRMLLTTIYALGLRIGEGLHLERSHIDGARSIVWIRDGTARISPSPELRAIARQPSHHLAQAATDAAATENSRLRTSTYQEATTTSLSYLQVGTVAPTSPLRQCGASHDHSR
jgi:integrase